MMEILTEPILLGIIGLLGGAGGLFTMVKSWWDYRANKAARIEDADERFVARLERKLADADTRIVLLEIQHEGDVAYIILLVEALGKAGIDVPKRQ